MSVVEALVFSHRPIHHHHHHHHPHYDSNQNFHQKRQQGSFQKNLKTKFLPLLAYNDDFTRGGGGGGNGEDQENKKANAKNSTMTLPPLDDSTTPSTTTSTNEESKDVNYPTIDDTPSSSSSSFSAEFESLSAETALLFRELRSRQRQLHHITSMNNWKQSKCTLNIRIELNDFVRRVAMLPRQRRPCDTTKKEEKDVMAVCGGARGGLYLLNLKTGEVEDEIKDAHNAQDTLGTTSGSNIWKVMYGSFDGGGVVSLGMGCITTRKEKEKEEWVASSGREGGASVWRIVTEKKNGTKKRLAERIYLDGLSSACNDEKVLVTSVSFDEHNQLWVACADGKIRCYKFIPSSTITTTVPKLMNTFQVMPSITSSSNNDDDDALIKTEEYPPILNIYICNELNCGVCVTAASSSYTLLSNDNSTRFSGSVHIFPLQQQQPSESKANKEAEKVTRMIQPFRDGVHARSVCIVRNDMDGEEKNEDVKEKNGEKVSADKYSLICGGSDGSLYSIPLNVEEEETTTTTTTSSSPLNNDNYKNHKKAKTSTITTTKRISWSNPFHYIETNTTIKLKTTGKMRPSHTGPVMSLTPHPYGGLFISGGQDGTVRVWSCNSSSSSSTNKNTRNSNNKQQEEKREAKAKQIVLPKCRYALFGYKFWLGSICTDGLRLVVDGTDRFIAVRDYSASLSSSSSSSLDDDNDDDDDAK